MLDHFVVSAIRENKTFTGLLVRTYGDDVNCKNLDSCCAIFVQYFAKVAKDVQVKVKM